MTIDKGTVNVTGADHFSGAITIVSGTVDFAGADQFSGAITIDSGALDLVAADKLTGGLKIDGGSVELGATPLAGSGAIRFGAGANATLELAKEVYLPSANLISGFAAGDTLKFAGDGSAVLAGTVASGAIDMASSSAGEYVDLTSATTPHATISGFKSGDAVDVEAVRFLSTDKVAYASGVVSVENSKGATVASFDVSGTYTAANFHVGADPFGHLLVSYAGGSSADLLDGSVLCCTPIMSAETYASGLADRHDGNVGGARDAWGVGVGSNSSTGHGPGPAS
jgi:hypothetical protein